MKRKILILAGWTAALVLLGFTVWYKLMRREVAQPAWVSETNRISFSMVQWMRTRIPESHTGFG